MFHRHGDRTPKSLAPTNLTSLGYEQVYTSGSYYRSRYIESGSALKIKGINADIVKLSQLAVTAPVDNVLQNSAMGFLQALYPPVGNALSSQTLSNGTSVQAPMDGYQLIPVNTLQNGAGSEDNGWLQDATTCANAKVSSNKYFSSAEYTSLLASTKSFYSDLYPVVNATFTEDQVTFKNAYIVFDLINVAEIHNATIPSSDVLTNETLFQVRTLADAHEWGLAYNASDNMRAVSGMQLAGEILTYMNNTINGKGAAKFGIQFGAYATFLSFFGLTQMPAANPDLMGVPDYASSLVFELFTDSDSTSFPATSDLKVRAVFHNGTASNSSEPTVYPLFGQSEDSVSWADFSGNLSSFAIHTTEDWCTKCGNTTGSCAAYASSTSSNSSSSGTASSSKKGGMSAAVGGVIGAMVTLAVILGLEALILAVGGLRLTKKRNAAPAATGGLVTESKA